MHNSTRYIHKPVRIAAYLAGLGKIGLSEVFLMSQFDPLQSFALVMTEPEPDPIMALEHKKP